jgi:hypothetical protein
MNLKNEWKWLTAFAIISILIIGLMTDLRFNDLDIQIYDTIYVVNPLRTFVFLTLILWTTKNFYVLAALMTGRYMVIALIVSIVNPLVGLSAFILFYMNSAGGIVAICLLVLLLILQTLIEIQTLRKLKIHFNNDRPGKTSAN